jgi:hypothetical protein
MAQTQDATPAAMTVADHPIVGVWRYQNPPEDLVPVSYGTYHADGTYFEVSGKDIGVGVWEPTGARTAELILFYQDIDAESLAFEPGTVTVRAILDLNEQGDAGIATYSLEVQAPDGTQLFFAEGLEAPMVKLTTTTTAPVFQPRGDPAATPTTKPTPTSSESGRSCPIPVPRFLRTGRGERGEGSLPFQTLLGVSTIH